MTYEETLSALQGLLGRDCRASIELKEEGRLVLVAFFLGQLARGVEADLSTWADGDVFAPGEAVFFTLRGMDAAGAVAVRESDFDIGWTQNDGSVAWIRRPGVQVTMTPTDLTRYRVQAD